MYMYIYILYIYICIYIYIYIYIYINTQTHMSCPYMDTTQAYIETKQVTQCQKRKEEIKEKKNDRIKKYITDMVTIIVFIR